MIMNQQYVVPLHNNKQTPNYTTLRKLGGWKNYTYKFLLKGATGRIKEVEEVQYNCCQDYVEAQSSRKQLWNYKRAHTELFKFNATALGKQTRPDQTLTLTTCCF